MPIDESSDIGFELPDGGMNTALEPLSRELSEPALDLIDPCLLRGTKRTCLSDDERSALDPKRSSTVQNFCVAGFRLIGEGGHHSPARASLALPIVQNETPNDGAKSSPLAPDRYA